MQGNTPAPAPTMAQGNNGNPTSNSSGGGIARLAMIIGGVLLVLLLGLGIGWYVFRRALLPQANIKLRPSGARPWSRTRVPDSEELGGLVGPNLGTVLANANAPVMVDVSNQQNGFAPQNYSYLNNGSDGSAPASFGILQEMGGNGYGSPTGNGYGAPVPAFGGFSDGFVPPSPQSFLQSDASMIPPGSGAFPIVNENNGFAPNSNAFNAMYGLPGDLFSATPVNGAAGEPANLKNGNGFGGPQGQPGANLAPGAQNLHGSYPSEVLRQYHQNDQALPTQQPFPSEQRGGPPSQDWIN